MRRIPSGVLLLLLASAARLSAQEVELPSLDGELRRAEALLLAGDPITEGDLVTFVHLDERAQDGATRAQRDRSGLLLFLATESVMQANEAEAARAAAAALETAVNLGGPDPSVRLKSAGLWASLGLAATSLVALNLGQYMGEAAYAEYAGSVTADAAVPARQRAQQWGAVAVTGAVGLGVGIVASVVFAALGGATSLP